MSIFVCFYNFIFQCYIKKKIDYYIFINLHPIMSDECENAIYCLCDCREHHDYIFEHAVICPCDDCEYCDYRLPEHDSDDYYGIEDNYKWVIEETPYGYCQYCTYECKEQMDLKEAKIYFDLWRKYILFLKK